MFDENKSVKIPTRIFIPILTFALGAVFFAIGFFDYGFWDSAASKPTKGFFPVIIAVALMAISVLAFIQGVKGKKVEYELKNWFVPAAFLAIVLASYVIGLVPAVIVFEILWLRFYEKQSWKTTLITLAIVLFIVVCCFQMWLGVDFPMGFIVDMILG